MKYHSLIDMAKFRLIELVNAEIKFVGKPYAEKAQ